MSALCSLWILALAQTMGEEPPTGQALDRAVEVCQMVVDSADRADVEPALAVALAWHESRLQFGLTSPCGATGPMQVIARYWCADARGGWEVNGEHIVEGCDLVEAGVRALAYHLARRPVGGALIAYGGTRTYADRVLLLATAIGHIDGE